MFEEQHNLPVTCIYLSFFLIMHLKLRFYFYHGESNSINELTDTNLNKSFGRMRSPF